MTEQSRAGLRELQRIDDAIHAVAERIEELDHQLSDVEAPAELLDGEVGTTQARLQEMRLEERRVELQGEEKRSRAKKLEDRLNSVRNVREESAVNAELAMVRRAQESDEQEALSLLDQIRRLEDRLGEQSEALAEARSEVAPRRKELEAEREAAVEEEARLRAEREAFKASLAQVELRIYEAIRSGGRRKALASLTEDGACGLCYSVVPLQVQNEIRHGATLIRCEACGVILAAPLPGEAEAEAAARAAKAARSEAPAEESDATEEPDATEGDETTDGDQAADAPAPDGEGEEADTA